jgi:hypothetical protein
LIARDEKCAPMRIRGEQLTMEWSHLAEILAAKLKILKKNVCDIGNLRLN